jgi:hypothetical protein
LIDNGALLADTLGREIDGNADGQPGGNFIATISGSRATTGGIPLARLQRQATGVDAVVDHLLARGSLAGVARSCRM